MRSPVPYQLVDDPSQLHTVADALASGRGPFAVDTERASSFRYGDRAFLVQIYRRGAGTFLIAPEGMREDVREKIGAVLNGQEWIIHAAGEDLRSLALLGLTPGRLFDTELASRLGGFDRPNLAAMVHRFVGVELEKGHGHEDWSKTPLPVSWRDYAALDVAYLHELAEGLAEYLDAAGKLEWAAQEFDHLIATHSQTAPPAKTWREVKGMASVRTFSGMQVARELWRTRDKIGRETDTSPSLVLSNRALVDIARAEPTTARELSTAAPSERMPAREAKRWQTVVDSALAADRSTWPQRKQLDAAVPPSKSVWERTSPVTWDVLQRSRVGISAVASDLRVQPEVLLTPMNLRQMVWEAPVDGPALDTHLTAERLRACGARPWQVAITAPVIARAHAEALRSAD